MAKYDPEDVVRMMCAVGEAGGLRVRLVPLADGMTQMVLEPHRPAEPAPPQAGLPDAPDVSVLFGTYRRLTYCQAAMESIRRSAAGASYESVVCDGGSDDGSREWLAAQPDVLLIGDRRLHGAVDAFNHCYRLSRGRFIANFNDDSLYEDDALGRAVEFMDAHPKVGLAIFAFRWGDYRYRINEAYPGDPDTSYASFGIARREAIEQVVAIQGGYWNPIYRTYAADAEQSAWIHRLGWQVARLDGLRVVDVHAADSLRASNESKQAAETTLFFYRWPRDSFKPSGPLPRVTPEELRRFDEVKDRKAVAPPRRSSASIYAEVLGWPLPNEEDRLLAQAARLRALDPVDGKFPARANRLPTERVLYISLATTSDPQAGLERALRRLGADGFEEVRWYQDYPHDKAKRQEAILRAAAKLRPTLVFAQLQSPNAVDVATLVKLRAIVDDPRLVIATWNGDIASDNSPWQIGPWCVPLGRACDITLHSSLSHVHVLRSLGLHTAAYLQIGLDPAQYRPFDSPGAPGEWKITGPDGFGHGKLMMSTYDVAFLGGRYSESDAFAASMKWHDVRLRNDVVTAMAKAFGDRFGLFGNGWSAEPKVVPLSDAHEVYWKSTIGLSVSLANYLECYTSDRLHRILGCGALALVAKFPLMSTYGLKHGENCLIWSTPDEAVKLARAVLSGARVLGDGSQAQEIAASGARLAREHLTWDVRVLELAALVAAARGEEIDRSH